MFPQTSVDILRRADQILDTAKAGLQDVRGSPERRLSGLHNLVVFGRAVTNVLQNLRATETTFDEWYAPIKDDLARDPLMKFFYDLRSRILKKGDSGVGNYAHIKQLRIPMDMSKFGPKPPNARAFFIGDTVGGTGWEVEVSPGVTEKYYVELPSEVGTTGLYFTDAPLASGSTKATDADVVPLGTKYIERLQAIVDNAHKTFG